VIGKDDSTNNRSGGLELIAQENTERRMGDRRMKANITKVTGYELAEKADGKLIFEEHVYVGKEPDDKFVYNSIKRIAKKIGITPQVASWTCSDEENGLHRSKLDFYFSKSFTQYVIGPNIFSQPVGVAAHVGHSSNVFIYAGHYGVYQRKSDKKILHGQLESERDGHLRTTCGAMGHVINRFLGKEEAPSHIEEWDEDKIGKLAHGLKPYKDEFLDVYNSGYDADEKLSLGMEYLVKKNIEVQSKRLVEMLKKGHNEHTPQMLVFGMLSMNRCKYPDTSIITQAYLIDSGKVIDLTKQSI
jgi:hypothetical protein